MHVGREFDILGPVVGNTGSANSGNEILSSLHFSLFSFTLLRIE